MAAEVADLEDPIELGWISVEVYDILKEEIVDKDFCSSECVVSFFND